MDRESGVVDLNEYRERREETPINPEFKAALEDLYSVHPWDAYAAQKRLKAALEEQLSSSTEPEPPLPLP